MLHPSQQTGSRRQWHCWRRGKTGHQADRRGRATNIAPYSAHILTDQGNDRLVVTKSRQSGLMVRVSMANSSWPASLVIAWLKGIAPSTVMTIKIAADRDMRVHAERCG